MAVRIVPVSTFRAEIFASRSTAPVASWTVPPMLAVVCAKAAAAHNSVAKESLGNKLDFNNQTTSISDIDA
jgi:hypothetical protein